MSTPDYLGLSRRYAEEGDLRMAQLAAWAADIHVLEGLLWENGLGDAPDPDAQLAAVGASVADSLEHLAETLPPSPLSVRGVVEAAREAMITTFDESVHQLLADRLPDLEHLDVVAGEDAATGTAGVRALDRLADRAAGGLVADLRMAAEDCAVMASLLRAGGEVDAARQLEGQAQAASFEAYLVEAAQRGGDEQLVTVDLRWDLIAGQSGRDRLVAAVGSAERAALRAALDTVETP